METWSRAPPIVATTAGHSTRVMTTFAATYTEALQRGAPGRAEGSDQVHAAVARDGVPHMPHLNFSWTRRPPPVFRLCTKQVIRERSEPHCLVTQASHHRTSERTMHCASCIQNADARSCHAAGWDQRQMRRRRTGVSTGVVGLP
jgi:hypothetical protein